jgi:hypothetical protein
MSGRRRKAERMEVTSARLNCTNISSSREAGLVVVAIRGVLIPRTLVVEAERLVLLTEPGRLINKPTLEPGHLTGSSTTVVAGSTPIMGS